MTIKGMVLNTRQWVGMVDMQAIRRVLSRIVIMTIGSVIAAAGYSLFQVPYNLAAGGVSGIAIIIREFVTWPVGLMVMGLNIPLLVLGYFYLGRWRFLSYTILCVTIFSVTTDLFITYLPSSAHDALTRDMLLSAIYAGIMFGIGSGMIFRVGGSVAGSSVIARIVQIKTDVPMSQVYLIVDGMVVLVAGMVFGWDAALHAMMTLFIGGIASDFAMEGPSVVRTATIVTDSPEELTRALREGLKRGASYWEITGSYTGQTRAMVQCTVGRSQVNDLRYIVAQHDPDAFLVIGNAHQAMGGGFMTLKGN